MNGIPSKMKAVVTHGPHDYRFEEVEVPSVGAGEILIKTEVCGICAGDIKAYKGGEVFWGSDKNPPYLEVPAIGGHEFVGRIVDISPEAAEEKGFKPGDRVTAEQIVPCGKCRYCENGQYWLCAPHDVFGFKYYLNGGFAQYVKLPRNALVYRVPDDLPLESAALIEPFSCSMHAVDRAKITGGDVLVISGCGPLGLGMVTAARQRNPAKLVVLDLSDDRLKMAAEFGADVCINPGKTDAVKAIKDMTGGYGCDVYIEATGHPSSVTQGLEAIRKAGRFVEFSLFNDPVTCNWSVIGDGKELDMYGVSLSPGSFAKVIRGLSEGTLKTNGVVTHRFPLERFSEAFETSMSGNGSIKVVFIP
jgi:2-desacetyl-2-hydroxyethyl bacteriochlorophyllide A dehydrogenase